MTTVLVLGASGFLGRHVVSALEGHSTSLRVLTSGREVCDLVRDPVTRLEQTLKDLAPDVVVNCTGRLDGSATELVEDLGDVADLRG